MHRIVMFTFVCLVFGSSLFGQTSRDDAWISDEAGNLGYVNLVSGESAIVGNTGVQMLDIAFSPEGELFGVGDDRNLYVISQSDAFVSLIGEVNLGNSFANSLVFDRDGTLLMAGSNGSSLYDLDPTTGDFTLLGAHGRGAAAGDLAIISDEVFWSTHTGGLVAITLDPFDARFAGDLNGFFPGLGSPDQISLFGASGQEFFAIDVDGGATTSVLDISGSGFGDVFGMAFFTEAVAVPEPGSFGVLAICSLLIGKRRRKPLRVCVRQDRSRSFVHSGDRRSAR